MQSPSPITVLADVSAISFISKIRATRHCCFKDSGTLITYDVRIYAVPLRQIDVIERFGEEMKCAAEFSSRVDA